MTFAVLGWMFSVLIVVWAVFGVITLVESGYLWPLDGDDDD